MNNKTFFEKFKDAFRGRGFSNGALTLLVIVIALAVIVCVNYLVGLLPNSVRMIDTSEYGLYEIGDITTGILDNLDDDVHIYQIAQAGSENDTLMRFVEKYAEHSDKISYTVIDPVLQPSLVNSLTDHTVYMNSLIVAGSKRTTVVHLSEIFIERREYDETTGQTSVTSIEFAGEPVLTSAIKYVTANEQELPLVVFITGHGERPLSDSYQTYLELENFSFIELSLASDSSWLASVDSIVINQPESDISLAEKQLLMDYFDAGGNILVFTTYSETPLPNLNAFLLYCGLESSAGLICESASAYHAASVPSGYNLPVYLYMLPNMQEHAITQSLMDRGYAIHMLAGHDITAAATFRDTLVMTPLLLSSESGAYEYVYFAENVYNKNNPPAGAQYTLGMLVEETVGDKTASLIWYGSGFLLDDTIDALSSGANSDLFVSSLAYLSDFDSAVGIHTKSMPVTWLSFSDSEAKLVSALLVAVLPLLALICGIAVWYKRRAR